jgi:hypothetical protein
LPERGGGGGIPIEEIGGGGGTDIILDAYCVIVYELVVLF